MAVKNILWTQKTGNTTYDSLFPQTSASQVLYGSGTVQTALDKIDVSKYLTTDTAQTVTGKKIFTGYYRMKGTLNSTDTAPQFYGLRIKGDSNYGAQLNFGDADNINFYEYEDDALRLHTYKFDFDGLANGLSINGNVGEEGQVLTSHRIGAPTWSTPSGGIKIQKIDEYIYANDKVTYGITDDESSQYNSCYISLRLFNSSDVPGEGVLLSFGSTGAFTVSSGGYPKWINVEAYIDPSGIKVAFYSDVNGLLEETRGSPQRNFTLTYSQSIQETYSYDILGIKFLYNS